MVVLTFWLTALAPALSQALAVARGEVVPWSQVCRSSLVAPRDSAGPAAAEAARDQQAQTHGVFAHCPFCGLQGQDLAPPPAATAMPALRQALSHEVPERFLSAPQGVHAWRSALARAPPLNG